MPRPPAPRAACRSATTSLDRPHGCGNCRGRECGLALSLGGQAARGRRYRLLVPVRQYPHHALVAHGEEPNARARHAVYYAALAERVAPLLRGPEQIVWFDRLETERDNLRAALEWIVGHGEGDAGLRLAVAMALYWEARGYLGEGRRWLEIVLASSPTCDASRAIRMRALMAAGTLAFWQRDLAPARALLGEAARSLADRRSEAEALSWLASVHRHLAEVEYGLTLSDESLRLGHELDDEETIACALLHQGMALGAHDEAERAIAVLEACLTGFRRLGNVRHIGIAATVLGRTSRLTGEHARASVLLREAVLTLRAVGDQANIVDALGGLAYAAMAQDESWQAAHWLAASRALRHALGMHYSARNHAYDQSIRETLQRQMTASEFDEAYARGEAMSLDQLIGDTLGEP